MVRRPLILLPEGNVVIEGNVGVPVSSGPLGMNGP